MASGLNIVKTQAWSLRAMERLKALESSLPEQDVAAIKALKTAADKRSKIPGRATMAVTYRPSSKSGAGKAGLGRLYSFKGTGIESLSRKLRGSLCEDIYHDLDIVNCQPTILAQFAAKYDFTLSTLELYIEHREAFLHEMMTTDPLMTRDEAKGEIIAHIFGREGGHPWVVAMADELAPFVEHLKSSPTWKPLYDLTNSKQKNRNGTFLAHVLATIERDCMLAGVEWMTTSGWNVDVLAYDGFMVRKREGVPITESLLNGIAAAIKEKTGYDIKLIEKPMESYLPTDTEETVTASPVVDSADGITVPDGTAITDRLAAEHMIRLLDDRIKKQGKTLYIYNETTGMWDCDEQAAFRAAVLLGKQLTITNGKETHHYGSMERKIKAMIALMPDLIPSSTWIADHIGSSRGKILFDNGIYDMEADTFTSGFNKEIVFTARVGRPLGPRVEADVLDVNNVVFKNPYADPDVGYYYAQVLARAIAGCTEDKILPIILGEPNTGKSTATTLMSRAFGGFVSIWNLDNLKFKTGSTTDEAKRLSWLADCIHSRLAISNEARMDGVKLDGNLAKRISGSDDITFRQNFRDERTVSLMTTFMAMANDMPDFSPIDEALRVRTRYIQSDFTFVAKPLEECIGIEKPADPALKGKIAQQSWQDAFCYAIFDAFSPEKPTPPPAVLEATDDYVPAPSTGLMEAVEDAGYRIVAGNEAHFVASRLLIDKIKAGGSTLSDAKLARELVKLGLKRHSKRVASKVIKGYLGLVPI